MCEVEIVVKDCKIKTEKVDVAGITKTWDEAEILDSKMEIQGFRLYRND